MAARHGLAPRKGQTYPFGYPGFTLLGLLGLDLRRQHGRMQIPCNASDGEARRPEGAGPGIDVQVTHANALLAAGIRATLSAGWARDCASQIGATPRFGAPGLIVTDLGQALHAKTDAAVLVVEFGLSVQKVRAVLQAGLKGCVSAEGAPAQLRAAAGALMLGQTYFCPVTSGLLAEGLVQAELTCREQQVLALLCDGLDNKSIAARMQIATATVKCHVKSILGKTGARTRTALAARAIRQGLSPVACTVWGDPPGVFTESALTS